MQREQRPMKKLLMTAATLLVLGNAPVLAGSTVPKDMLGSYAAPRAMPLAKKTSCSWMTEKKRSKAVATAA